MIRYPHITAEEAQEARNLVDSLDREWQAPFSSSHLMKEGILSMYKTYDGDIDGTTPCPEWLPHRHWVSMRYLKVFATNQEIIDIYRPILLDLLRNKDTAPSEIHLTPFYNLKLFADVLWLSGNGTANQMKASFSQTHRSYNECIAASGKTADNSNLYYKDGVPGEMDSFSKRLYPQISSRCPMYDPYYFRGQLLAWNGQTKVLYLIRCINAPTDMLPTHCFRLEKEVHKLMERSPPSPEENGNLMGRIEDMELELLRQQERIRELEQEMRGKIDDLSMMLPQGSAPAAPSAPSPSASKTIVLEMLRQKIRKVSSITDPSRGLELQEDLEGLVNLLSSM